MLKIHHGIFPQDMVPKKNLEHTISVIPRGPPHHGAPLCSSNVNVSDLKVQEDITKTPDLVQQSRFQRMKTFFTRGRRVVPLCAKNVNVSDLKVQEDITNIPDLVQQSRFQRMKTFLCRGHSVEPLKIKAINVKEVTPINKAKDEEEPSWIKHLNFAVPLLTLECQDYCYYRYTYVFA